MLIIAERINASRKSISQAISDGDREFIQNEDTLIYSDMSLLNVGEYIKEFLSRYNHFTFQVKEFEGGVMLVGKILQPVVMLKAWKITPGEKHKLGTIASLFGSAEFPDVVKTLRTFRVFPG